MRFSLWPVHRRELPLLLPLIGMAFLICVNYYLLRCLKDSLLVAEVGHGAAIIPFVKLWAVLPATLLAAFAISKALKKMNWGILFATVLGAFTLYFSLFAFVLYPFREALQLPLSLDWLPSGFAPLALAIRFWPLTTFYIAAELWKIQVLMVLFWGLVNQITSLSQAKRTYNLLMVSGSLSALVAGPLVIRLALPGAGDWEDQLRQLTLILTFVSLFVLLLLRSIAPALKQLPASGSKEASTVRRTPLLVRLGVMIIADYIAFNITEVYWQESLFRNCSDPQTYCAFLGKVTLGTGILATLSCFLLSGNLLRMCSWRNLALAPVLLGLILAGSFFILLLMGAPAAVFVGALHNMILRASRDTFSDPARQLVYVQLPPDVQASGKPFVCGLCPTAGKATSSLLQQGCLALWPSLLAATPIAAFAVSAAFALWGRSIWVTARFIPSLSTAES